MVMKSHGGSRVGSISMLALSLALVLVALGSVLRGRAEVAEGPDCLTVRGEARMHAPSTAGGNLAPNAGRLGQWICAYRRHSSPRCSASRWR